MPDLRWKDLFRSLFLAGFLGYLSVAISGIIWIGIPVLMLTGWLSYNFRKKIVTFKRIFKEELPVVLKEELPVVLKEIGLGIKAFGSFLKRKLWGECQIKIYSYTIVPIIITLGFLFYFSIPGEQERAVSLFLYPILPMIIFTPIFWFFWMFFATNPYKKDGVEIKLTDELIGRFLIDSCKFIFWQVWKFILKVIVLTIREVHSRELVAVSIYSLLGMLYILILPPFLLAPKMIFLMAIGCGIFTGLFGLAMHKVLSTTFAQAIFVKVEAW